MTNQDHDRRVGAALDALADERAAHAKPPMSRSKRRNAMEKSGIRGSAFTVYCTLLMIEALAPANRPKTEAQLAGRCGVSVRALYRALAFLELNFWIVRERGGGKDNPTRIVAVLGLPVERTKTKTNAEKCRDYRRRKKAATPKSETQTTPEVADKRHQAKGRQSGVDDTPKVVSETRADQAKRHTGSLTSARDLIKGSPEAEGVGAFHPRDEGGPGLFTTAPARTPSTTRGKDKRGVPGHLPHLEGRQNVVPIRPNVEVHAQVATAKGSASMARVTRKESKPGAERRFWGYGDSRCLARPDNPARFHPECKFIDGHEGTHDFHVRLTERRLWAVPDMYQEQETA